MTEPTAPITKPLTTDDTIVTLALSVKNLNHVLLALDASDLPHKIVKEISRDLHKQGTENLQQLEKALRAAETPAPEETSVVDGEAASVTAS